MTRPDKHAARFGVRYRPRLRPLRPADVLRMFGVPRRFYVPKPQVERWTFAPHTANPAAPTVAELEAGTLRVGDTVQLEASGEFEHFWHVPPPYRGF